MMRYIKLIRYAVLLAVIAAGVLYARTRPITVNVHVVRSGSVVRSVMGTGTLEARIRATISPKISGRISEVLVDQGSLVKAGDLLVRLDDEDLLQQVRIAEASISATEATVGRFHADLDAAKSTFTKAQADFERAKTLADSKSISAAEIDQVQEGLAIANSGLLKAEASLLEAQQNVALSKATLSFQETRLEDTRLIAPFDGLITERLRDPGSVAVPGTPLLQLVSLDELWISAWVDETEMDQLQEDQPAQIVFRSQPDVYFEGVVARLGKQTDRETREFTVDVRVMHLPETWSIGQRAEVFVEVASVADALLLPSEYLTQQEQDVGVFVNVDGVARWRQIDLGLEGREAYQVLNGLAAADQVVMPAASRDMLYDGVRVTVP